MNVIEARLSPDTLLPLRLDHVERSLPAAGTNLPNSMSQIDEQQFADLYSEAFPRLWTLATAILGDQAGAEDTVQDAAITALRRLGDFEQGTSFNAWMSQIVRFTALNRLKAKKNRKALSLSIDKEEGALADTIEAPLQTAGYEAVSQDGSLMPDQQAFDDQTARTIKRLDPERRTCLLLRIVHDLSYEEIAQVVGLPEGTAMSHVYRAKIALKNALSPQQSLDAADLEGTPND